MPDTTKLPEHAVNMEHMSIQYTTDPNNAVNIKIQEAWDMAQDRAETTQAQFVDKIHEICDLMFEDGQSYVWKMRQMRIVNDKAVFPGDPDYDKYEPKVDYTLTTSENGVVHTYHVTEDGFQEIDA